METILWNFREEADQKAKLYEFYHLNSEHTARTQSFNAPIISVLKRRKRNGRLCGRFHIWKTFRMTDSR